MRRCAPMFLAAWAVVLLGCEHDEYEITMRHDGEVLHRKLTVRRVSGVRSEDGKEELRPYGAERLAALEKVYARRTDAAGRHEHTFHGTFSDRLPEGIGSGGAFARWPSPLGAAWAYVERFRGEDDPLADLMRRLNAADWLVDCFLAALKAEVGETDDFARLAAFIDGQLRRDLKNTVLYVRFYVQTARVGWVSEREKGMGDVLARLAQYFLERGYYEPKDVPAMVMLAKSVNSGLDMRLAGQVIRRFLADKVGVKRKALGEAMMALLADPPRLQEAVYRAVGQTQEFQQRHAAWREAKRTDPEAKEPTAADFFQEMAGALFAPMLGPVCDVLSVEWAAETEPLSTNGEWDPNTKTVSWSARLQPEGERRSPLPTVCHALWVSPSAGFQKARFGQVALTGGELVDFCLWWQTLPAAEAKRWDRLLVSLRPGDDLAERVRAAGLAPAETEENRCPYSLLRQIHEKLHPKQEDPNVPPDR